MITAAILTPEHGWGLMALFSVLWIGLGLFWGRRSKSLEGHMVANRNVGLALGSATAMATWVTSNTTMLAPQFALELGVWGVLAYSMAALGLFFFAPLAGRIRALMPAGYTSGQFVRLRYGHTAWVVFVALSLFYGLTWLVSMGMAGGLLIEALTGVPYLYGMSAILCVCTAYTVAGGLVAVIGTDFIQSVIILVGVVVVAVLAIDAVSVEQVHAALAEERPMLLDVLFPAALMAIFNNLLFGLGEVFHSNVWWSRAFAMRPGVGTKAYALAGAMWLPIPIVGGFLGLVAPALGIGVSRPDMVAPLVAGHLLGQLGAVLVFVVVFASIASSIDSLLAATSDLVTNDLVHGWLRPNATPDQLRKTATQVVVGTAAIAWVLCVPRIDTLATVLFFAGPMVASMIWPIVAGLYWKRTPAWAATAGMILGTVGGLCVYFTVGWYAASTAAAAISAAVVIVATLQRPADFRWEHLKGGARA
ncbi:MAG: urea transporter [Myxococcales bacterium FL481]|nr:MAG: urea transporter [Myxococcales bacterium FL481]